MIADATRFAVKGRHVSMALAFAVAVQTAGVLLWVGAAGNRIARLERDWTSQTSDAVRLARLEEQVIHMRSQLDRIERRLTDQGRAQ